jgi:hypothetical protein
MTLSLEAQVREALERMTPGPWCVEVSEDDDTVTVESAHYGDEDVGVCADHGEAWTLLEEDAAGIVLLRNSAPELLAELARMRAELARAENERDTERERVRYYESTLCLDNTIMLRGLWSTGEEPIAAKAVEPERVSDVLRERDQLRERFFVRCAQCKRLTDPDEIGYEDLSGVEPDEGGPEYDPVCVACNPSPEVESDAAARASAALQGGAKS